MHAAKAHLLFSKETKIGIGGLFFVYLPEKDEPYVEAAPASRKTWC